MRDAFGGSFMIKLFLVFIIIYVGFTAVALNYAKAFKVKNKVVEYLETNEITGIKNMPAAEFDKMEEFFEKEILGNMNYRATIDCSTNNEIDAIEYAQNGICIIKKTPKPHSTQSNKLGVYYEVSTTIGWSIPFINKLLALDGKEAGSSVAKGKWIISGETRLIVRQK